MPSDSSTTPPSVLILSADVTAAALLGALVETLGYTVGFAIPPESTEQAIRRARPKICLVDGAEPELCREDVIAHAVMRGVRIVPFGTPDVLMRLRDVAARLDLQTLRMPTSASALQDALLGALSTYMQE
jgi:CheY-like chemotaxis protein